MFGLLKNKITSFIDKLSGREQKKEEEPKPEEKEEVKEEKKIEPKPIIVEKKIEKAEMPEPKEPERRIPKVEKHEVPKPTLHPTPVKHEVPKQIPQPAREPEKQIPHHVPKPTLRPVHEPPVSKPIAQSTPKPAQVPAPSIMPPELPQTKKEAGLDVRLSIESKVRSLFSSQITIKDKDVDDLLEQLELDMLEADVAYEVAQQLREEMRKRLVGMKIGKGELKHAIEKSIEASLLAVMEHEKPDVVGLASAKSDKPFIILFLGPNGAGKTTSIAKFVHLMRENGMTSVIALADTFRAASQEQGMEWANRLGVKAVGGPYGSDAAAVAYNAREHAKSKGIDIVLIDSAGRQETSKNLMEELAKIVRVVKPDFKIYIGEAIAGNSVVEQVREFDKYVGVDGVILTKADVDAKGGSAISIYRATGKPILYLGVGQRESDLREFDAQWVVRNVMGDARAG